MSRQESDVTMLALEHLALAGLDAAAAPEPEYIRDIVVTDLPMLAQELRERNWSKANARSVSPMQTLRLGHQQLAQLIGNGVSPEEAAFVTGRSPGNVAKLMDDPAFKDLVTYYTQQHEARQFDAYGRLVTLGGTAMEVLQERLEESPERFTNNELRQIMESTMDRSAAPARGAGDRAQGASTPKGLNVSIQFIAPSISPGEKGPEAKVIELKANEEDDK